MNLNLGVCAVWSGKVCLCFLLVMFISEFQPRDESLSGAKLSWRQKKNVKYLL